MPLAHLAPSSPFYLQLSLFREEHDHMYVKNTKHMTPVVENLKLNCPQWLAGQAAKYCVMLDLYY